MVRSATYVAVEPALGDRDVQQRVGEREVGAGQRLQVQVGLAGGGGDPRVDDDQLAAALAAARSR